MVRDPAAREEPPDVDDVLGALADEDCQTIIATLDEPRTASEVSEVCDIPLSTTYRKLDRLSDAALLTESTEIRRDGQHATRYAIGFESVTVSLDEDRELTAEVERPERTMDERLAELWSEVRKEA